MIIPLKATIFEKFTFTPKNGLYIFTSLFFGGADRRQNIGGLTVPVATGNQIVFSREQAGYK
jgi:hypothetical protein